ncbi:hypothetical protein ACR79M_05230 [Sphingobacterium spiritivorum]|uniref:hypothetical protein n=1 Tax=Sphingobacterium spiritivorum TaxID=258 RepID=UPI003DA342A7
MELKVYDEDGIFAIVNNDTYRSFVHEDWSLEQLQSHFVREMNNLHCIVCKVSDEGGDWLLRIMTEPSSQKSYKEFKREIEVTNGRIYFVNYTDLTMAAQFDDETLPLKKQADWYMNLDNGYYEIEVRQMFDPEEYADEQVIEIIPTRKTEASYIETDSVIGWND